MRAKGELALLLVLLAACSRAPAPAPRASGAAATPRPGPSPVPIHVTSSGDGRYTTLTEMRDRRTIYTVRARSFVADSAAGEGAAASGIFDRPHIVFVDRGGAQTVAEAPKAVLASADKSIFMTGGVEARSADGDVLHCDRLRYDGRTERVHGDGHVVLQTPSGLVLTGDTLDGDVQLDDVRVEQRP